jgi:hypothetical protein
VTVVVVMENAVLCLVPVGIVFQLGGAPPHFFHCVHAFLKMEFSNCWMGRGGSIPWSLCSPNLSPLDFSCECS